MSDKLAGMSNTSVVLLFLTPFVLVIVGAISLYLAPRCREFGIGGRVAGLIAGIRVMFIALLALAGVCLIGGFIEEYFDSPHPRPRVVVQVGNEDIVTVNGITDDGWLTDCFTGYRRHITGNYTLIDDEQTPIVCVHERHYDEWLKSQRAASGGSQQ